MASSPKQGRAWAGGISADDFCAWQHSMNWPNVMAARALGASANSIARYRERGGSRTLALACAALAAELEPWSPKTTPITKT